MIFQGVGTALITPFTQDNKIDFPALRKLIDFQVTSGANAIVILGTTGENPTISKSERRKIVQETIDYTNGRVPVIVGTGTNNTMDCIRYSLEATEAGADGLLVVGPYYNKPSQEGLIRHFRTIGDATDTPIILYNVPGRTGNNILPETILRIVEENRNVVGVKEASGNLTQISTLLAHRPPHLSIYAGDDELALPLISLGAAGVISVISNAFPDAFSRLVQNALMGYFQLARKQHFELLDLMRACFIESNPVPIKAMLAKLALIEPSVRLPLVPLSDQNDQSIALLLRAFQSKSMSMK